MFDSLRTKKLYILFAVVILSAGLYFSFRDIQRSSTHRELVVYSNLHTHFFNALADAFTKDTKINLKIRKITELNGKDIQADLILTNSLVLDEIADAGSLETLDIPVQNALQEKLSSPQKHWISIFYDPVVLVINREYGRKYGQTHLTKWDDLLHLKKAKIVVDNFNSSIVQNDILGCFSSNMGEKETLKYFSQLNKFVVQYAKFPFTPVRMIASEEADMAITLRSSLYEFSDNSFPAYFVEPEEGTPVVVYGAGIFKGSDSSLEAKEFINWLVNSFSVKNVALQEETGYRFLNKKENSKDRNLWLNYAYKDKASLDKLVLKWYGKVRFGKYK